MPNFASHLFHPLSRLFEEGNFEPILVKIFRLLDGHSLESCSLVQKNISFKNVCSLSIWEAFPGLLEMEESHPEPGRLPELPLETRGSHNRPIADEREKVFHFNSLGGYYSGCCKK